MKAFLKTASFQIITLALVNVNFIHAQEFGFANSIGDAQTDRTNEVAVDGSGNVITVGQFQSTVDLDPGVGTSSVTTSGGTDTDGFIYKVNTDGDFQWGFAIGNGSLGASTQGADVINSVDVDASGNVYITGLFTGIVDFDPSAGTSNLTSTCSFCAVPGSEVYTADAFWAKYDSDGNFVAAFSWGSTGYDQGLDIEVSSLGDIYIVGNYEGTVDFDPSGSTQNQTSVGGHDIFVARYNSSNQLTHILSFGSTATTLFTDYGTGIDADGSGNYYVSGYYTGSMNLNPNGTATNIAANSTDGFLAKYNSSGVLQWGFDIGANSVDKVNDLVLDASENVYLTGEFAGTGVDFDPDPGVSAGLSSANSGNADIFVAKYSSNGVYDWAFRVGGPLAVETGNSISLGDEAIFVAGKFNGTTVNFNPTGNDNLSSNSGANGFIASYDLTGAYRWAGGIITSTSTGSEAFSVDINSNNDLAIGGAFAGTADFDVESGVVNLDGSGGTDAFTSKYTSLCISTGITVDVANLGDVTATCSVTPATPTATDDCGNSIDGVANITFPVTTIGTTTVTWTYTDGNGNEVTQDQDVIIEDNTAPVPDLGSLPDITGECSVEAPTAPKATDNCAGSIDGVADVIFPVATPGTTIVTWTFEDENGNSVTQEQNVIIEDVTDPVPDVADLPDIAAECSIDALTPPAATDNCDGSIIATTDITLPFTAKGTTAIVWTYTDAAGNSVTQEQNLIIADETAPVADLNELQDITSQCPVEALTAPTATDNCDGSIEGTSDAVLPITDQGETVITWTYEDSEGNTSTQTQRIVIEDTTPPVPDVSTLEDIVSDTQVDAITAPTATDNCGEEITGTTNTVFPITEECTTVVTWEFEDSNGNVSAQNQNVIINDNSAPVVDVAQLSDVTGECSVVSVTPPTATDACDGSITGETDIQFPITTQGTTTITWTFEDNSGNTTTQTQDVIIIDNTSPLPDTQSLEDITETCQVVTLTPPTATDDCFGPIDGQPDVDFPITNAGTTTITWTFTDEAGNSITQQQNVIIQDDEVPVPDVAELPIVYTTCDGILESLEAPTATDNCAGSIIATTNQTFPFQPALDTTVIVWEYDDGKGNENIQFQSVVKIVSHQIAVDTSVCVGAEFTFPDGSVWDGVITTQESALTSSLGCDSVVTTNINILAPPEVDLGADTVFACLNEELAFGIDEANTNFDTYTISTLFGNTSTDDSLRFIFSNAFAAATTTSNVFVTIEATDAAGCVGTDQVQLIDNTIFNWSLGIVTNNDPTIVVSNAFIPEVVDSFEWDFGDGTTNSVDENPTHTYTENGEYNVSLTVSNECGDESQSTLITIQGIEDVLSLGEVDSKVIVYPNPVSSTLKIDALSMGNKIIEINNVIGQVVYKNVVKETSVEINLENQPSGVYFISIHSEGKITQQRIIKQ